MNQDVVIRSHACWCIEPYNTGNDFVYNDDFAEDSDEYFERSLQKDEEGNRLVANPESKGRYHSDWLSMMHSRLRLARNLLTDDGVIFISIDDNEQANLKRLCDEVFGEQNFISQLVWEKKKKGTFLSKTITNIKEYIIVYSKNKNNFAGLIGEINTEETTYPCINASNKREVRKIPAGIMSKYREENFVLSKGNKISVTTMDLILHSDLVIENNILAQDLEIEGNWRYSQDLMYEYALKNELYLTQDLYLRRIVKEPREKTLKDLLPRVGKNENSYFKDIDVNNLFIDGWGSNEDAEEELRLILKQKGIMSFPKPKKLIEKLIASIKDDKAIILDFFAGSSTTAHAVCDINSLDGGNRKFIMVQLPEATDEKSEAYKAGYKNIAEISKERIRRAGKQILESDNINENWNKDIGFRVLKTDESNMKDVFYKPQDLNQSQLFDQVDNVKEDRNAEDLLFQIMLDWELELSLPVHIETIQGKQVYCVAEDALIACFDQDITEELVKELATKQPMRLLFRDNYYANNDVKINAGQLVKQLSPKTELKSI